MSSFYAYAATTSQSNTAVVNEQTEITLSGLKSSDPDNDNLSYFWEQIDGEPVAFSSNTDFTVTFTSPAVCLGETKYLKIALTVNDGHGGQALLPLYSKSSMLIIHR